MVIYELTAHRLCGELRSVDHIETLISLILHLHPVTTSSLPLAIYIPLSYPPPLLISVGFPPRPLDPSTQSYVLGFPSAAAWVLSQALIIVNFAPRPILE